MKKYLILLFVGLLALQNNAFSFQDCTKLKGAAHTKCEEDMLAEIKADLANTDKLLDDFYAQQEQWSEDLDKANQHLNNATEILGNGTKRMQEK